MTPPHPIWSARAVVVDPDYCALDAPLRDNVTMVTAGIERLEPRGIVAMDGRLHEADVIVYASGFHAMEFLYPMTFTGRRGQTLEDLWAKDGARAYLGCILPGFPNLWSIYGPNTNGGLPVATFHEKTTQYACSAWKRWSWATVARWRSGRTPSGATTAWWTNATSRRCGATRSPTTTIGPNTAARPR